MREKMKFEKAVYVEPKGLSGKLTLWRKEIKDVKVKGKCKNLINIEVRDTGMKIQMKIFWIYGPTDYEER